MTGHGRALMAKRIRIHPNRVQRLWLGLRARLWRIRLWVWVRTYRLTEILQDNRFRAAARVLRGKSTAWRVEIILSEYSVRLDGCVFHGQTVIVGKTVTCQAASFRGPVKFLGVRDR